MQMPASNLLSEIAKLQLEIASLEAARQRPHVSSVSSSASPSGEPGWSKTSHQIELEAQIAEMRRKIDQGGATAEEEGEPSYDDVPPAMKPPGAMRTEPFRSNQLRHPARPTRFQTRSLIRHQTPSPRQEVA